MYRSSARFSAVALVLCAMLLRGLMPAGWMPSQSAAAGAPPFVICTMDGLHRGTLPPGSHDPASGHGNQVCPFAAAAHLAPPQKAPVLLPSPVRIADAAAPRMHLPLHTVAPAKIHAPRAPPLA